MSRTVDERVVSMQFDNKHFEQNIQTSLNTVSKLKNSLKLDGAATGLENIDKAAKNVNMTGLAGAVDTVRTKFSALQVMAITALANITNSAVNAGKRLVASFTIDPIKTGLSEYETQINAVQTVLANTQSKGTTLDDVNKALDELNLYADKTIYNFTEMTRNIGTFTAAGVELDTSVAAIKGIANLAAVSGSTSHQASTAMYQLSQALSSGTVKLMDWNSVVNAGMGGQVFQDALKETARASGISIDEMIKKEGSFRETLHTGWLTSEVLLNTLKKFTGDLSEEQLKSMGYTEDQIKEIIKLGQTANDAATKVKTFTQLMDTLKEAAQSGWTQTWEILIGDFEEAKKLWTSVSDVFGAIINDSSAARNNMLQGWSDGGGRVMAIEAVTNSFEALMSILKPIKEAFREVFPPLTSKQLLEITEKIRDLTKNFKLTETQLATIKKIAKGVFSVISIGIDITKEIISGTIKLAGSLLGLSGTVVDIVSAFSGWVSNLRDAAKETSFFSTVIGGTIGVLQKFINKITEVIGILRQKISAIGFEWLLDLFKGLWEVTKWIGNKIVEVTIGIGKALSDAFNVGNVDTLVTALNGGLIAAVLLGIKKILGGFSGSIEELGKIGGVFESFSGILDSVKGTLEAYQNDLKANTLLKIAGAIAILAASILVISLIKPERLATALGAIGALFATLLMSMTAFVKIGGNVKGVTKASVAMISMSVAVLILAAALKIVSEVETDKLFTGILGIAALSAIVVLVSKALSKNTETIIQGSASLIAFALAIKILASSVISLSSLNWDELKKGLLGVGVLLGAVAIFLKTAKFESKAITNAIGILIIASAIKILASAVKDFSGISSEGLIKGLGSIAAILLAFAGFTRLVGNPEKIILTSISLVVIASSMKIFASAMNDLSQLSWSGIEKGLRVMGAALLAVIIAVKLIPLNIIGISIGLLVMSAALLVLSTSIKLLGGMSWEELAKGLLALGVSIGILTIALKAIGVTGIIGSVALAITAVALALLVPSLVILSTINVGNVAKGLLALSGAFIVLGIAGYVLIGAVPTILALSVALALIGVASLAFGAGIVMISAGLTALAAAFSASGTIIVTGITSILVAIIGLIPSLIQAIGQGIVLIASVIANSVGAILSAIAAILVAIAGAIIKAAPSLITAVFVLLDNLLSKLVEYMPKFVQAAFNILIAIVDGITNNLPKVMEAAFDLIIAFLDGLAEGIPRIINAGFNIVIKFLDGLTKAIDDNMPIIVEKVRDLFRAILRASILILTGGIVDIKGLGGKIMNSGLIEGIRSKVSSLKNTVGEALSTAKKAITDKISEWIKIGGNIISGLIQGVKDKFTEVKDAAVGAVSGAVDAVKNFLGIHSPSTVYRGFGKNMDMGLIMGLNLYSKKVSKTAEGVGKVAVQSMSKTISGISDIVNSDINSQPTIRPVLDLSDVRAGAGNINDIFGMEPSIGVLSNIGSINSMMNKRQPISNLDVVSAIKDLGRKLSNPTSNTYNVNGITYDDGSNIATAIQSIMRAAKMERRMT